LLSWWKTLPVPPAPSDPEPQIAAAGDQLLEVRASTLVDARGGTLLWIRDVTASRRAELDQMRLASRLREQERIESLTVMAAGLAHDFNNLLTAVLGNADYLVATSPADSERRASAEAITAAAQPAADLVSQIVAFSGQKRALPSPVSIEDAVGDVLRALLRTLGERALVTHESHPDLPLISADTVQIRQAVFALLTNAVDAVAPAHGSVEVLTGRETLDAAALAAMDYSAALGPGDYVFIDVKDDGPGIPDALIPRIFEPFFSTRDMGRGLGLAAVHGIVRGHNGAIRIWTGPAIGTRVRVWWPLS
jgi:signal transduction histidine kinase